MTSNLAERFQTLHEIVKAAKHNLAPGPWDYLVGGAETETTLRRNRQALDSFAPSGRACCATYAAWTRRPPSSAGSVRLPVMLAPIGSIESLHAGRRPPPPRRLRRVRRAADAVAPRAIPGSRPPPPPRTTSASSSSTCAATTHFVDDYVKRAINHGYAAFCMTVDTAMLQPARARPRPALRRSRGARASPALDYQAALSWEQVKRFKDTHSASRSS
mgnify:CR=1 FL=1